MINVIANLNWISVLVAFLAYSFLGAVWFTVLFGKWYKISLGKANENLQNSSPIFFVGPALCSLVVTITTAVLLYSLNINTYGEALSLATLVGVGYLFANTVMIAINPNMPRPLFYGLISGTYHLTAMMIVCSILVAMK